MEQPANQLRLGKKEFVENPKDFKFSALKAAVPIPWPKVPNRFGHGLAYKDWGMLGNGPDPTVTPDFKGSGDCVFAGAGHETMLVNKLAHHKVEFTGANVVSDYSAVTGYVIGDDSTDYGTEVREAMSYRRKTGVIDSKGVRHQIGAYVSIDPKNWDELMQAVYCFTAVGIGFEFPDTAWQQLDDGLPWDVVDENPTMDGGHYVPIVGRNARTTAGCITWGVRHGMTQAFYEAYNDESWAMVFPEELRNGKTARGYDLATISAWLGQLT